VAGQERTGLERPTVVVTTSYPEHCGDAQGHFVASEVAELSGRGPVVVLAPGHARRPLGTERVVSLGGGGAFGFPGALSRLEERPWRAIAAATFVSRAIAWLRARPAPVRLIAHFLVPCGIPIATRSRPHGADGAEIVVHGSDARLFARAPFGQALLGRELLRSRVQLRFVSSELLELVLGAIPKGQRSVLEPRCRVEPCVIAVPSGLSRDAARQKLGIAPGARAAVIVSRLVSGKRVHVALEACERVPGLLAIVVGDGPERAGLMRRFPGAVFTGHVERCVALEYIAAADVLVSASLTEGAPSVVREARALGTEVVCLPAGDVRSWAALDPGIHVVG